MSLRRRGSSRAPKKGEKEERKLTRPEELLIPHQPIARLPYKVPSRLDSQSLFTRLLEERDEGSYEEEEPFREVLLHGGLDSGLMLWTEVDVQGGIVFEGNLLARSVQVGEGSGGRSGGEGSEGGLEEEEGGRRRESSS